MLMGGEFWTLYLATIEGESRNTQTVAGTMTEAVDKDG